MHKSKYFTIYLFKNIYNEGKVMKMKLKIYIIGILIPLLVGGLSAFLTRNSMNIYESIITPPLSPPSILFPIVWTILFFLMGISSARIYTTDTSPLPQRKSALYTYALSLIFNFFWSFIFFTFRQYLFAFFWLLILLALVVTYTVKYFKINKTAGLLNIPYIVWLVFAGILNFSVYLLN